MQKPLTIALLTYYSIEFKRQIRRVERGIGHFINRISGRWYCAHCNDYHSKRIVEFDFTDGLADSICSLGVEAAGIQISEIDAAKCRTCCRIALDGKQAKAIYKKFVGSACDLWTS